MRTKKIRWIDWMFIAAALICLALALWPSSGIKAIGDHFATDGNMERLTPELIRWLHLIAGGFFALFAFLFIWGRVKPDARQGFFRSLGRLPGRWARDIGPFFRDLGGCFQLKTPGFILFLLIFFAGTVLRVLRVSEPLLHDEAYSMAIWGRSDLLFAISDYHLPNNHVFHSVLVNLVYHHIGKTVPLLRLPVLVSGCLLILGVWLLGKTLYNDFIALTAAGLTAFAPFLVFYSVNARGYELLTLFSVLTVGLAVYVRRKNNIFAWSLLILLSGLNFFTLPIALYPFGGICLWLFLNVIFFHAEESYGTRGRLFKYLITMGLCVSALSMLLYTPLLRYSGWNSFFGNIYIGGTEESTYNATMLSRLKDNVQAFTDTLPVPVIIFLAAGLLLSPFAFRHTSRERISYGLALGVWMGLLIPFQRPNLWPRTLLFLHPFLLLFCASGISLLRRGKWLERGIAGLSALMILWAGVSQFVPAVRNHGIIGPDEQAVQVILEREGANASNIHFVTAAQDNAPLWIYADAYGLDSKIFDKRIAFNTVYAFVNPKNDSYNGPKDLYDLMARFGPGDNFYDPKTEEILMDLPNAILYRFEVREGAIRKSYGEMPEVPQN